MTRVLKNGFDVVRVPKGVTQRCEHDVYLPLVLEGMYA